MKHVNPFGALPRLLSVLVLAGVLGCAGASAAEKPRYSPRYEEQVGKEAAAEIDKVYDRVDNAETAAKVQAMADAITVQTQRPVKYEVRLVKEKKPGAKPEVNAFSLPGGIIYVTEALATTAHSDHELAGVIAHEIAHNVHYDGLVQAERANKIFKRELAAILATILIGGIDNEAWATVMQAGLLYRHSVLGGYSIEMEKNADMSAVRYMLGTQWDPVGLLTFMERLAAEDRREPPAEMGVFQTHPLSAERVRYLIGSLLDAGVPINRRKTANWVKPAVEEREVNGKPAEAVVYLSELIFACDAPAGDAKDPRERATKVAEALTEALAGGAQSFNFVIGQDGDSPALMAFDKPIFTVQDEDAALLGKPPIEVLAAAKTAIAAALSREGIARLYGGG